MFSWLARLFFSPPSAEAGSDHPVEQFIPLEETAPHAAAPGDRAIPPDEEDRAGFLLSLLCSEVQFVNLYELPLHDREFIASCLRSLKRKEFEIPLLPGTTIRIQQLLANPDARLDELVDIFRHDPPLAAELLRLANSSYLSYIYPTLDIRQAIVRVGFSQLNGLVMVFSLRSRILHARQYQNEVMWVTELSLAMAKTCQLLAGELRIPPEEAFTLGLMHHIEYLVILGEAARFKATHHGQAISRIAVAEAIRRTGTQLHSQIAQSWGISNFDKYYHAATGEEDDANDVPDIPWRLDYLQRILIQAMSGGCPEFRLDGFDGTRLQQCVEAVTAPPSSSPV